MNDKNKNIPAKRFILVLNNHVVLGYLLMPCFAKVISTEVLEIEENATLKQTGALSDCEQKIIAMADSYSDKNLMKRYSKEKNITDFFRKLPERTRKEMIMPYIQKKHREILELILTSHIPLYVRDTGSKQLYNHHQIHLSDCPSEASFHFELTEEVFRYSAVCTVNEQIVSLQKKKPIIILSASPAIVVIGHELLIFKRITASKLTPFFQKKYVEVPVALAWKYLEKIMLPLMQDYPATATGITIIKEMPHCKARLSVASSVFENPVLQLHFRYDEYSFFPGQKMQYTYPSLKKVNDKPEIRYFVRDEAYEQRCIEILEGYGFRQVGDAQFTQPDFVSEYALVDWINRNQEELGLYFSLNSTELPNAYFVGEIQVKQDISDTPDWFEILISVQIGEYSFPFTRFKKHILAGERSFRLPDGKIALLPEEWFEKYADLFAFGEEQEEVLRLRRIHTGMVAALNNEEEVTVREYTPVNTVGVPPRIRATLRSYQQTGFSWLAHLYANRLGGCLADDMGLGKTLQTITLLQHIYDPSDPETIQPEDNNGALFEEEEDGQLSLWGAFNTAGTEETKVVITPATSSTENDERASLIVVPTSLLPNWKKEIRRFCSLRVYEYVNEHRSKEATESFNRYHVVLITYGLLRKVIGLFESYPFRLVILDESQNIKNPDSLTYQTVIRLKSDTRFVLTGTPIENSLKDLWAQFNFINPGLLGSLPDFKRRFVTPIVKEGNDRARKRLQQLINPFFLRRTKQQVAPELPPLTEEVIYCDMPDEQREIYIKEKNILRNSLLAEQEVNPIVALNGITRLRQLANHPRLLLDEYAGESGKMNEVLTAYETLISEGHKVLMFSSFVTHLRLLAEAFDFRGWQYAMLTGSTVDRQREIDRFSTDPQVGAFFISLKAGGVGLNLTEADYVFLLDPWWNPAAEMQAESRAHRIGQSKQVFVYRFITQDTIEEKIRFLQEQKSKLAGNLITENNPLEQLTNEEWKDLLS